MTGAAGQYQSAELHPEQGDLAFGFPFTVATSRGFLSLKTTESEHNP